MDYMDAHKEELNLTHIAAMHGLRYTNVSLLLFVGGDIGYMHNEVKVRVARTVSNTLHSV